MKPENESSTPMVKSPIASLAGDGDRSGSRKSFAAVEFRGRLNIDPALLDILALDNIAVNLKPRMSRSITPPVWVCRRFDPWWDEVDFLHPAPDVDDPGSGPLRRLSLSTGDYHAVAGGRCQCTWRARKLFDHLR